MKHWIAGWLLGLVTIGSHGADATVVLPDVFSSGMVLQRDVPIPIWGQAPDGTKVAVIFGDRDFTSTASNGRWKIVLPAMDASAKARKLTVSGSDGFRKELTDILIGDVWLASGQSNMEMHLRGAKSGEAAIAASTNPLLRLFTVSKRLETIDGPLGDTWKVSGPATSPTMSAVAYFFAQEIQKTQGIPVGLINCSYGGTVTETWCSPKTLAGGYPVWEAYEARALKNPKYARRNTSSRLYNRMLRTVMPFPVKGFIWYQGEGNAGRAEEQKRLFPAMVKDWRQSWGNQELPFYIVQLARFEPATWHPFRIAQLDVWQNTPHSYMAVTVDLSKDWKKDNHPIHPSTKAPIGHRLALAARAQVYGETKLVYSGPVIRKMSVNKKEVILTFDHRGSGLIALDRKPLRGFAVSADGKNFVPAVAKIVGKNVVLSAAKVSKPIAVRYGAEMDMEKGKLDVNLGNKEKLPASPFTISLN
ncbi:MAG: sialate O-acetylesterase [Limisphaerales bacterium]